MKSNKKAFVVFLFNITAVLLSFIFCLCPSHATDYYWNVDTGYWGDAANWNPNGVPGVDIKDFDKVYVTNTTANNAMVYVNSPSDAFYVDNLGIYGTGAQTATLSISEGIIFAIYKTTIGINGVINQTGGSFSSAIHSSNLDIKTGGTYNLDAGSLRVGALDASGVFNQTGGSVKITDMGAFVGAGGVYNLNNGTLNTDSYVLAVRGTFNQYGGSVKTNAIHLEGIGTPSQYTGEATYNQFGGEVTSACGIQLSGSSTYNLMGGSLILGDGRLGSIIGAGGILNYSGGSLSLVHYDYVYGENNPLINNGTVNLMGEGTRTISGSGEIINNGTFKVTNTTAVYSGKFTNNGAYISDPAAQYFQDLVIGQTGYIVGQHGDKFYIEGNFFNNSTMNNEWNTMQAYLAFLVGDDNMHDFYLTGQDFGQTMSAYANNFSWGTLDLTGNSVYLFDGNDMDGGALYLREILGLDISGEFISNITGVDGMNIYYMSQLSGNEYLKGLTYKLNGGGYLMPIHTPEPASLLLLGLGLIGLAGVRRKIKK